MQLIALVHRFVVQGQGVEGLVVDRGGEIAGVGKAVVRLLESAGVGSVERPVQIGLGPRAQRGLFIQRAGAEPPLGVGELPALIGDIGRAQHRRRQAGGIDGLGLVARRIRRGGQLPAPGDDLQPAFQQVGDLFQPLGGDDRGRLQPVCGPRLVDDITGAALGRFALALGGVVQARDLDRLGGLASGAAAQRDGPCAAVADHSRSAAGEGVEPAEIVVPAPAPHRPGMAALALGGGVIVVGLGLADVAGAGAGPEQEGVGGGGVGGQSDR